MWQGKVERGVAPDASVEPLDETTLGRRIWALYVRAGYSRSAFASVLGVAYTSVDNWVQDQGLPSVAMLARLALMFRVSADDLIWGRGKREEAQEDFDLPELLSTPAVCAWLREQGADDDDIDAALRMVGAQRATAASLRMWWMSRRAIVSTGRRSRSTERPKSTIGLADLERATRGLPDEARKRRRAEKPGP